MFREVLDASVDRRWVGDGDIEVTILSGHLHRLDRGRCRRLTVRVHVALLFKCVRLTRDGIQGFAELRSEVRHSGNFDLTEEIKVQNL